MVDEEKREAGELVMHHNFMNVSKDLSLSKPIYWRTTPAA